MNTSIRTSLALFGALACAASATVYRPGLMQYRYECASNATADFTKDLSSISSDKIDRTYGCIMGNKSFGNGGSNGTKSDVSESATGTQWWWDNNTTYAYDGEIWLDANTTNMVWGNFDDGSALFIGDLSTPVFNQGTTSGYSGKAAVGTFTAPSTGWYTFRGFVWDWSGGKNICQGALAALQWNNKDYTSQNSSSPWQKFTCDNTMTFLRTATDESFMTVGKLDVDGNDALVNVSFAGVTAEATLRAYYGGIDGGTNLRAWGGYVNLATIAAGDTAEATYTIPDGKTFSAIRLCLIRDNHDPNDADAFYEFGNLIEFSQAAPSIAIQDLTVAYTQISGSIALANHGIGGVSTTLSAEIAVDSNFANILDIVPVATATTATGAFSFTIPNLTTNTLYYIRATAENNLGASGTSASAFATTLTPGLPSGSFMVADLGNTYASFSATLSDPGAGSSDATLTMQVSATSDFASCVESDPASRSSTGTSTLTVGGLASTTDYYARLKIVNTWGLVAYTAAQPFTTLEPFVCSGIGYRFTADGLVATVALTGLYESSATISLYANGALAGVREVASAGNVSFQIDGRKTDTELRAVVTVGTASKEYTATAKAGTTGRVATLAELPTLLAFTGDVITLPQVFGTERYASWNDGAIFVDGNRLVCAHPGVTSIRHFSGDTELASAELVVIDPPAGNGKIYRFTNPNGGDWDSADNWTCLSDSSQTGYPSHADDVAIVYLNMGGDHDLKLKNVSSVTVGDLYVGASAAYSMGGRTLKLYPNGASGAIRFERTDGKTPLLQISHAQRANRLWFYFGNNKDHALDIQIPGGLTVDLGYAETTNHNWSVIGVSFRNGSSVEVPAGKALTLRNGSPYCGANQDNGIYMEDTFTVSGAGDIVKSACTPAKYSGLWSGFSGRYIDESGSASGYDRTFNSYMYMTNNAAMTIVARGGQTWQTVGTPGNGLLGGAVARLGRGMPHSWSAGGEVRRENFNVANLVLRGGQLDLQSTQKEWEPNTEVSAPELISFGDGLSCVRVPNAGGNQPTNILTSAATAHVDGGMVLVQEPRSSNPGVAYASVGTSGNTRGWVKLDGLADFAIGDGSMGDGRSGDSYPVIPWMVTSSDLRYFSNARFATLDADGCIGASGENNKTVNDVTDPAANVYSFQRSLALSEDKTVNSLRYNDNNNNGNFASLDKFQLGAGRTLTITSGGLMLQDRTAVGIPGGGAANGSLSLPNRGYLYGLLRSKANAGNYNGVWSAITAPKGVSVMVFGENGNKFVLGGDQTGIDGEIAVNMGTLLLGSEDGTYGAKIDCDLRLVGPTAAVEIENTSGVLDRTASIVRFQETVTGKPGKIVLGEGVHEKCLKLYVGDSAEGTEVSLPRGSYGATGSDAEFIDDTRFAGLGTLFVCRDDLLHPTLLLFY